MGVQHGRFFPYLLGGVHLGRGETISPRSGVRTSLLETDVQCDNLSKPSEVTPVLEESLRSAIMASHVATREFVLVYQSVHVDQGELLSWANPTSARQKADLLIF